MLRSFVPQGDTTRIAPPAMMGRTGPAAQLLALAVIDQHLDLVLEAARFDHAMHAALLRPILLPPPAAGAGIGARLDRPRARRATNALVALVVQRVVRHVVVADVVPDLLV